MKKQFFQKTAHFGGRTSGQLVSLNDYTVNYADKKFEPTIGEPDNSVSRMANPSERV